MKELKELLTALENTQLQLQRVRVLEQEIDDATF